MKEHKGFGVAACGMLGSITTWEDLTTHFLARFFPLRRTAKLRNNILMFQQHHEESLSEAWTRFKDLLQKVRHHGIDLWPQAINLPQDVLSTSDHRLIELENQAQCLMEAHLAPMQLTQVNKVTTSCEICSGPHDTQNCIEDPKQAFVEYASSCTDEARGEVTAKMEDLGLFTLPCRLGDSKPLKTLADLRSRVNIVLLYHIFGLVDGTKSYPIRIVKDVEMEKSLPKPYNQSPPLGSSPKEKFQGKSSTWTTSTTLDVKFIIKNEEEFSQTLETVSRLTPDDVASPGM
uniref:MAK10-like protein n=1 Tax=Tanacetum cinerariifolium TaxID=118510 RepID=A0A699H9H3_TANCI|nr:MAK10-like protein [Tanacetum cinerariifolium]